MFKRVVCLAALSVGLVATSLGADYLHYRGNGAGTGGNISGTMAMGGPARNGVFAGQLKIGYGTTQAGAIGASSSFAAFCISPDKTLPPPTGGNPWEISTPTSYTSGTGSSVYDKLSRLVSWGYDNGIFNLTSSIPGNNTAASFQVALWMVVSGAPTQSGWSGGQLGSAASGSADWLIANVANVATAGAKMAILTPLDTGGQTIVTYLPSFPGNSTPVPEPFTMGIGLAAAGVFVRRRMTAKKSS